MAKNHARVRNTIPTLCTIVAGKSRSRTSSWMEIAPPNANPMMAVKGFPAEGHLLTAILTRLRRYPAEPRLPRKVLLVPAHRSLNPIDDMAGLANAVAFAWVADEDCLHAHILQCNVELLGLREWHIVIVFTVN